jgi:hypothetical protein
VLEAGSIDFVTLCGLSRTSASPRARAQQGADVSLMVSGTRTASAWISPPTIESQPGRIDVVSLPVKPRLRVRRQPWPAASFSSALGQNLQGGGRAIGLDTLRLVGASTTGVPVRPRSGGHRNRSARVSRSRAFRPSARAHLVAESARARPHMD